MRVPIHIRYTLKDGRTLCRTVDVLKAQTLEKLLELDQTDCIREERVSGTRQMIRDDAASLCADGRLFSSARFPGAGFLGKERGWPAAYGRTWRRRT